MIKLSDYVVQFLVDKGIHDIFLVSGGGIMHLLDSVGRNPGMNYYCNYHEQACAIAAESYARLRCGVGACLVTTGPGSTNALSGIAGAWVDSIPVIVISGQVRRDLIADYSKLRQLGPQEINIEDMARPITKYITTVRDPLRIRWELEYSLAQATGGRPGPVWINLPLDVQVATIDERALTPWSGGQSGAFAPDEAVRAQVRQAILMLRQAKRPVLICGQGVRLAGAEMLLGKFLSKARVPVLLTIGAMDMLDEENPSYLGKFGPGGQRRANFALQNSDLVLSLGASMSVASIGFNTKGFAPQARRIMVNLDAEELKKRNYTPELAIRADVKLFLEEALSDLQGNGYCVSDGWWDACLAWKKNYPLLSQEYYTDTEHVNSYVFVDALSDLLLADDAILTGNALDAVSIYQAFRVKAGQRVYTNINYGAMGWDLPAAVGACIARNNRRTVLVTGDGSVQFNVQELMTLGRHHLNVKIFVLNNGGYESIRATQQNFFEGRLVGADQRSGIANPDFAGLAAAYGLRYERVANNAEIHGKLSRLLTEDGPTLCELNISYTQPRTPKASSFRKADGTLESRPLEDMFPFLPREEVWRNMHLFDETEPPVGEVANV